MASSRSEFLFSFRTNDLIAHTIMPQPLSKITGALPQESDSYTYDIFSDDTEKFLGGRIGDIFPMSDVVIEPFRNCSTLQYIDILTVRKKYMSNFAYHACEYKISLKHDLPKMSNKTLLTGALVEMVEFCKNDTVWGIGDRMNLKVENKIFNYSVSTGYIRYDMEVPSLYKINQIIMGAELVKLTDWTFTILTLNIPRGRGRSKIINLAKDKHTKKCIKLIHNNDKFCAVYAILIGMTYHTNKILDRELSPNDIDNLRRQRNILTELAMDLLSQLQDFSLDGFTFEDIKSCEIVLDIQVKVVSTRFNNIIYSGYEERPIKIYLYYDGSHYDLITKMAPFYGSVYFCERCDTCYRNKDPAHRCKLKTCKECPLCKKPDHLQNTMAKIFCNNCNRYCFNEQCLIDHSESVCTTEFKCPECSTFLKRGNAFLHMCGYSKCKNCDKEVEVNTHKCYMVNKVAKGGKCVVGCKNCDPGSARPADEKCTYTEKYIFFDYEAQQQSGVHVPNLVIAHYFSGEKFTFNNNKEFCEWLIAPEHKGYTAISHYGKGYDSHFIIQYCVANTILPNVIYNGNKLMQLHIRSMNLRIIDSHNFIAAPLATFPKTFNLTELKKGYFPHLFNTPENENYVGPIPSKEHYCCDTMTPENRKKFIEWHDQKVNEGYVFDFAEEIAEYCDSDVDILRRGCLDLRLSLIHISEPTRPY